MIISFGQRLSIYQILGSSLQAALFFWGCVKSFFMALRAKLYLDGDIFFLILRSKIRKKMSPSKEYFAAEGGKRQLRMNMKKIK